MARHNVLIELDQSSEDAFELYAAGLSSEAESIGQAERLVAEIAEELEIEGAIPPVPMFARQGQAIPSALAEFAAKSESRPIPAETIVVAVSVPAQRLGSLSARDNVRAVWPNSEMHYAACPECGAQTRVEAVDHSAPAFDDSNEHLFDQARSDGGEDCRPYRPAATIDALRELLGVDALWRDGYRGQNVVVGIIDEGVNGQVYPVTGGFEHNASAEPGSASIQSHGSMCAADVLVAAPAAMIYDYPFLGIPNSGGAIGMFQSVLGQRRMDGTPHLTSNSYAFFGKPSQSIFPNHEIYDIDHPLHRKVREVVGSGAPVFFAAGNCGAPCPDGRCKQSIIGDGSIVASAALEEVITVSAVNSRHERIGYSGQGPGGFYREKPDISAYSHFFGNYGPGRPAGGIGFDSGTSAACPVAAGVGALLLSAIPSLTPDRLKEALTDSAHRIGGTRWSPLYGDGVINAASAYRNLVGP